MAAGAASNKGAAPLLVGEMVMKLAADELAVQVLQRCNKPVADKQALWKHRWQVTIVVVAGSVRTTRSLQLGHSHAHN